MGSDIVFSIWPIFVTTVLHANMQILGLIDGLGDAIVSISQAFSGYLSDKIKKRKIFVWTGYLFGAVSRIGYALSPTWNWLIPFRLIDRSGKFRGAPRDAIISDVSNENNRGRHFGILRTMDNLGAIVGILITFFFLSRLGFRNLFLLAAIPSTVAVVLVSLFIKEKFTENKIYKGFNFKDINKELRLFMILSAVFAFGSFSYSFLIIFAKNNKFPISETILLYFIFTLIAALTSYYFGRLSDRIGRKKVIFISFVLWAIVCILFIFSNSYFGILIGFIFYGLHRAAFDTVPKTLVAELSSKQYLASTLGTYQMVIGLCALPASFLAGFFWDKYGAVVPFCFSLFLTVISSFLLVFIKER